MRENLTNEVSIEYPVVFPGTPIFEAGIHILGFYFDRLVSMEAGTILGEDIENLHDMRVASRRLRVAMNLFGKYYDQRIIKKLMKGLRRTGNNLGRVRDYDVLIEKMGNYMEEMSSSGKSDISPIMDFLMVNRCGARVKMLDFLGSRKYRKFKNTFTILTRNPQNKAKNSGKNVDASEISMMVIKSEMDNALSMGGSFNNPSVSQLHKLRIALKKLRYTIEFFVHSVGEQAATSIEFLKAIQDYLGEINDLNMLLIEIGKVSENKYLTTSSTYEYSSFQNSERFISDRQSELLALIGQFPGKWQEFQNFPILDQVYPAE